MALGIKGKRQKIIVTHNPSKIDQNYQSGRGNRLCYELMFNYYNRVIVSGKPDAEYKFPDISLEYKTVTLPDLARRVSEEYQNMALPDDRILNHTQSVVNKLDMKWNWTFNMPCKGKSILSYLKVS